MAFVTDFNGVITVVTGAATAVREGLISTGCGDVNRFCPIVPGNIAWDECDCGMLAQTITQTFPSNVFPTAAVDQRQTACGPNLLVVNVLATLVRCVPIMDDNGNPPNCLALEDAAVQLECDRQVLRYSITCYLRSLRDQYTIHEFSVGAASSTGPEGACAGIELPYQFAISNLCC